MLSSSAESGHDLAVTCPGVAVMTLMSPGTMSALTSPDWTTCPTRALSVPLATRPVAALALAAANSVAHLGVAAEWRSGETIHSVY